MALPLMPRATAVWLVENTKLTFAQVADFCGMHELEVQGIADGEVATGMKGLNPVYSGQLTLEEIARCEENPVTRLKMVKDDLPKPVKRSKGPRYTPVSKRQDKPDGIYWLVKHHPELLDAQIARLIGTTKPTIAAIRDRQHWNSTNIKARHPASLGLCTMADFEAAVAKAQRRIKNAEKRAAKEARLALGEESQGTATAPSHMPQEIDIIEGVAPAANEEALSVDDAPDKIADVG